MLFDFSGLFVVNSNEILYSQETQITFWCPMRFHNFPLDSQTCKFKVLTILLISHDSLKTFCCLTFETFLLGWKLCV